MDRSIGLKLPGELASVGSRRVNGVKKTVAIPGKDLVVYNQRVGIKPGTGFKCPQTLPCQRVDGVQLVIKPSDIGHVATDSR